MHLRARLIILSLIVIVITIGAGIYIFRGKLVSINPATKMVEKNTTQTPSLGFSLNEVKVGDKIGAWTIAKIEPAFSDTPLTKDNVKIDFSGEATITGDYRFVVFEALDFIFYPDTTKNNLPYLKDIPGSSSEKEFKFREYLTDKKLPYGNLLSLEPEELTENKSFGSATIVIRNYSLVSAPTNGIASSAELVDIIEAQFHKK